MTDETILRAARAMIATPERWCKGARARNADDKEVGVHSLSAQKYCLIGALEFVVSSCCLYGGGPQTYRRLYDRIVLCAEGPMTLSSFNDAEHTTHADVIALLDKAISYEGRPICR